MKKLIRLISSYKNKWWDIGGIFVTGEIYSLI